MTAMTLVRNATVLLELGPVRLLVDPMLNPAGAVEAVEDTAPVRRNPLVALPGSAEEWSRAADAVLVTHLHTDHFDAAARRLLDPDVPIFCQPADRERLAGDGFRRVTEVDRPELELAPGLRLTRVPARHTLDVHEEALGPGSGYVVAGDGPVVYVAGDCVWCPELAGNLEAFSPEVVVVNAGAARFLTGPPISMSAEDVIAVARHAPDAQIVAVHLEALNHCPMTRDELRRHTVAAGVGDRVAIPADGERLVFG